MDPLGVPNCPFLYWTRLIHSRIGPDTLLSELPIEKTLRHMAVPFQVKHHRTVTDAVLRLGSFQLAEFVVNRNV